MPAPSSSATRRRKAEPAAEPADDQRPTQRWHPANWGQAVGLGLLWLLGQLPYRAALRIGEWLGLAISRTSRRRRHIALRNLDLCFPDVDAATRERWLTDNFRETGRGLAEAALAWYAPERNLRGLRVEVSGREHLERARASGRPLIALSAHFLCVEIAARLLPADIPITAIYKPTRRRPLLHRAMLQARLRSVGRALSRDDVRGMLKALKRREMLWYAGDQDYGGSSSVFVPFFGQPACTLTALTRLTALSGAAVIPMFFHRQAPGHYVIRFEPVLDDFPGDSPEADAVRTNRIVEQAIRRHPEQYLWIHRRFKRQQDGAIDVYGRLGRKAPR